MSAETKEDILREMRMGNSGDMPFAYLVGMPDTFEEFPSGTKMRKINIKQVTVKELADRFEAAFKRESAGNVAAMRDALVSIAKVPVPPIRIRVSSPGPGIIIHEPEPEREWLAMLSECVKRANAALAAPARNCDLFSRSYKKLHTAWLDWLGSPSGHLPDGTAKMTFAAWLLAQAADKGGTT
jgi:hypothetical protein